jgi:hypothetical protein
MRDTVITKEQGFIGPYGATLKVKDMQRMYFSAENPGPFWLSPEEQNSTLQGKGIDVSGRAN